LLIFTGSFLPFLKYFQIHSFFRYPNSEAISVCQPEHHL